MSTSTPPRPAHDVGQSGKGWAMGLTVFAGALMVIAGVWHALVGIAALFNDEVYVATPQYIYAFDLTAWGWTFLLLGVLVAAAGVGVFSGKVWARTVGVVLAGLSLVANFLFIPYYPIWALLVIALDAAVIWALVGFRRESD